MKGSFAVLLCACSTFLVSASSAPTAAPAVEQDNSLIVVAGSIAAGLLGFNFIFMSVVRIRQYIQQREAKVAKIDELKEAASTSTKTLTKLMRDKVGSSFWLNVKFSYLFSWEPGLASTNILCCS
jgi:hypothetical protein